MQIAVTDQKTIDILRDELERESRAIRIEIGRRPSTWWKPYGPWLLNIKRRLAAAGVGVVTDERLVTLIEQVVSED
jgi:hypothetical protein